jgi:hypothetical protein
MPAANTNSQESRKTAEKKRQEKTGKNIGQEDKLISGNLAIFVRPMAFRPCLATGLALFVNDFILHDIE